MIRSGYLNIYLLLQPMVSGWFGLVVWNSSGAHNHVSCIYIYRGGATIYIYIIYAVYINMSQKPGREVPGFQPAGPEN